MSFSPALTKIFSEVERLSGLPVTVDRENSLPVPGRFRMARGGAHAHFATYNPSNAATAEYHLAFEAAFALRLYSTPVADRALFASTGAGLKAIQAALVDRPIPPAVRDTFASQLHDGLLTQLRSQPIGMRVNEWLRADYPALGDMQEEAIAQEQSQAAQALSPSVEAIAPPTVYSASIAMNAATALFADRLIGVSRFAVPYAARGVVERGQKLLEAWEAIPSPPEHDRSRVDRWAETLDVTAWYQWVPLS